MLNYLHNIFKNKTRLLLFLIETKNIERDAEREKKIKLNVCEAFTNSRI